VRGRVISRWAVLTLAAMPAACLAAGVRSAAVEAYEVYSELTVNLSKPAEFTCEAGAEPHTLVLTVAAEAPADFKTAGAGRILNVNVARAKGATTFILETSTDAGTYRAYARKDPPSIIVGVYRRLDTRPAPRPEAAFKKLLAGRKLLLVDDDDGPGNGNKYSVDVDEKYRAPLERLGVPYDVHVVRAGASGPTADRLAKYPFVIWFNGLDARPVVISGGDESAMAAYVAGGGRLWLVSQNYLSDSSRGKTSFCRDVLGISSYKADTQVAAVAVGPAGASLPLETYSLSNDLTIIGNWGDGFKAPADAAVFFSGPEDGLCYGMVRPRGEGRVAFFSVALENVGYEGRIADIMEATLNALAAE
jgi:hypothetical protein